MWLKEMLTGQCKLGKLENQMAVCGVPKPRYDVITSPQWHDHIWPCSVHECKPKQRKLQCCICLAQYTWPHLELCRLSGVKEWCVRRFRAGTMPKGPANKHCISTNDDPDERQR
jgi:hypothetical protein